MNFYTSAIRRAYVQPLSNGSYGLCAALEYFPSKKARRFRKKHCVCLFNGFSFFAENEKQISQERFFIKICIYIHLPHLITRRSSVQIWPPQPSMITRQLRCWRRSSFYFLHKRHISIPFGPISRGTDANEVFVYVHTKNIFAQRLLGAVRVFL